MVLSKHIFSHDIIKLQVILLICFGLMLISGCFLPFQVDEEYCNNNQHLIECFGGELVWDATAKTCRCVCDEGKWGSRCQYDASRCSGTITIDSDGDSVCDCSSLPECTSRIIYVRFTKFCNCRAAVFSGNDEDDSAWFGNAVTGDSKISSRKSNSEDPDYFPLGPGQAWLYDMLDSSGTTFSQWAFSVQDTFLESGILYYDMQFTFPDSSGNLESVAAQLIFNSPDDPNEVHFRYSEDATNLFTYHQFPDPGNYIIDGDTLIIATIGQVEVPAGVFENCMSLADPEAGGLFIYAPDVGLIKVINEGLDNMVLSDYRAACTLSATASFTNISCAENVSGSITLSTTGANGDLNYTWSGPTSIGKTANATDLEAGTYAVTVSDDVCSITIPELVLSDTSSTLSISAELENVACFGDSTGAIDISIAGGSGNYRFNWNDSMFLTEDITNLSAGSYELVVTDTSGCSGQETFIITETDFLEIELVNQMAVNCNGAKDGSIEVVIHGGHPPYILDWNDGQFDDLVLNGLSVGAYDLEVQDANGCIAQRTFILASRPSTIPMTLSVQGLLKDSSGQILEDGFYDLTFRLYDSFSNNTSLWEELQLDIVVTSGIFSAVLGSVEMLDLCFDQAYYMGISIEGDGELSPRLELTASPYSFIAKNVEDGSISTSKVKDMAITPEKISVDIVSGINGVRNDGGEINLIPGEHIEIIPNKLDHSITISSAAVSKDSAISAGQIIPDVLSSINGVSNDGGNVSLVAGENITVEANDSNNTIIISASGQEIDPPVIQYWKEQNGGISYKGQHVLYLRNDGSPATQMTNLSDGTGYISSYGPNGFVNVQMSSIFDYPNNGFLSVNDFDGITKAALYVSSVNNGVVYTNGGNGNTNNLMSYLLGYPDHGLITANDANGDNQAGIYVDANGQGRIFADFYDSFVEHPTKSNIQIRHSNLQGPEVGIYLRGTAHLHNGSARVDFPDHYKHLISQEKITVMITPLSVKSKGIAVTKKSNSGFYVQELFDGNGNYEFDWEVKGIRIGTEKFEIFQKKITGAADQNKVNQPNQINK